MPSRSLSPVPSTPAPNPKGSKPLSAFSKLSQIVKLYEPDPSTTPAPSSPTTILLCSWMNASTKHIDYYTRSYMRLFPGARIILISINTTQFVFTTETTRRAQIQPAISALLSVPQENERLLVHVLSNGGAKRLYGVSAAYAAAVGKPLPLKAYILDSAPGIPQFRRDIHALNMPARNWPWYIRVPFHTVVVLVTCVVYVTVNWMPKWFWHELVWGPHEGAHNYNYLDRNCVKGFIYSKEDQSIDWRNVEAHAKDTEERGFKVVKKLVENAPHVQLFRGKGGEDDYWGFIKRVWDMGTSVQPAA